MKIESGAAEGLAVTAAPDNAVETRGLTKVYRASGGQPAKKALDAVDLAIPRGSLFGLLGPNGAGKSTFINILGGLVNKTAGTAQIWGIDIDTDPRNARAAIGVVPQELNIDPFFTPRELLEVQAGLYGVPEPERRTNEVLAAVGLADKAEAYARSLSGGMRRRMLVAKAMVHAPPILVLDEPTAGVDVELRQQLWAHIRRMNDEGTTILLTTHYLEEAEQLCDRIAIINHGRVIACDTTLALLRRLDRKELAINLAEDLAAVPGSLGDFNVELANPRRLVFRYRPSQTRIRDILSAVRGAGLIIADLTTHEADLEDLFIELTRKADET
ncbi:MAG: ABC transporter ATP-binding protein [Alphaproteobacteria bacterium]|nr:ABC transporter ATP-binding protein [Alphaproteobacteria bacterium]